MGTFREDLKQSERAEFEPLFQQLYRHYFPNMVEAVPVRGDTPGQRLGHDRLVYLDTGKVVFIDEKMDYSDSENFVMEFVSNDQGRTVSQRLGWLEKPLQIDYILYVCQGLIPRRAFLLPWHALRRVWEEHRTAWLEEYGVAFSKNDGYNTHFCPVPYRVVLNAIHHACKWEDTF